MCACDDMRACWRLSRTLCRARYMTRVPCQNQHVPAQRSHPKRRCFCTVGKQRTSCYRLFTSQMLHLLPEERCKTRCWRARAHILNFVIDCCRSRRLLPSLGVPLEQLLTLPPLPLNPRARQKRHLAIRRRSNLLKLIESCEDVRIYLELLEAIKLKHHFPRSHFLLFYQDHLDGLNIGTRMLQERYTKFRLNQMLIFPLDLVITKEDICPFTYRMLESSCLAIIV